MADNFLASIQTGIQMGHAIDSAKMQRAQMERMAEEMTLRKNAQLLEMAKYQEALGQQKFVQDTFAPPTTKRGGDEYTGPMPEIVPGGPGREALRGQYGDMGDLAANMIYGGMKPTEAKALLPKEASESNRYMNVGGNLIDTKTDPTRPVFTAQAKANEPSIPLFVDVPISKDMEQKYRYNPETKNHDIPIGQPKPIYKPAQSSTDPLTGDEIEAAAQMLASGAVTLNDLSKRGGIKQQAELLKRAKEINPTLDPRAEQANNAAFQSAITMQQKQIGMMGSFVKNMEYQVGRVKEIAKELKTFDQRILNVPLRAWRQKIAGSPMQAKYDMYITEIESEIGKLATGSAASISDLSVSAQDKWAKIHDKNLSVSDMISLLEETSKAGKMRMKSVESQLAETQAKMRTRNGVSQPSVSAPTPTQSPSTMKPTHKWVPGKGMVAVQ